MLLSIEISLMLVVIGRAAMLLHSEATKPVPVVCTVRRSAWKDDRAA